MPTSHEQAAPGGTAGMPPGSPHAASLPDRAFLASLEAGDVIAAAFDHDAHLRAAYVLLCDHDVEAATDRMRATLLAYLAHIGVDAAKYHETITRAWIEMVAAGMRASAPCDSFAEFRVRNPRLADRTILRSHYSATVLASPEARRAFVPPDLSPFPTAGY